MEVDETNKEHIFQILSEQTNIRDLLSTKNTVKTNSHEPMTGVESSPAVTELPCGASNTNIIADDWATDDIYMDVVE